MSIARQRIDSWTRKYGAERAILCRGILESFEMPPSPPALNCACHSRGRNGQEKNRRPKEVTETKPVSTLLVSETRALPESSNMVTIAEGRYQTLLEASSALAEQPTVKAVLHSVRNVLSSISRLHGAELYVLTDDGKGFYTFECDRDADAPAIRIGTKGLRIGAVAQALDGQKPVFVPDLAQEMLKHPDLAPFA